jgi:hypothetical protein
MSALRLCLTRSWPSLRLPVTMISWADAVLAGSTSDPAQEDSKVAVSATAIT